MQDSLAAMIAKRFIQRKDIKAIQKPNGDYMPDCEWIRDGSNWKRGAGHPWMLADLEQHLAGTRTFGHYLLDMDDKTKLFAFDVDLDKTGSIATLPNLSSFKADISDDEWMKLVKYHDCNPREVWQDRAHPDRPEIKAKLRRVADLLASAIWDTFGGEVKVAAAYSGSKGVHVYGFVSDEGADARKVQQAAMAVLKKTGRFELDHGNHFYRSTDQSPLDGFPGISIEVFPKQTTLSGKDLGNLMRLPLGRNLKSSDPTFFLDLTAPINVLVPHPDPVALLKGGNPWAW